MKPMPKKGDVRWIIKIDHEDGEINDFPWEGEEDPPPLVKRKKKRKTEEGEEEGERKN